MFKRRLHENNAILRLIPFLKINNFCRKNTILKLIYFLEIYRFRRKHAILKLIYTYTHLKIYHFRRKNAILRLILYLEIEHMHKYITNKQMCGKCSTNFYKFSQITRQELQKLIQGVQKLIQEMQKLTSSKNLG